MTVGATLREAREKAGLTGDELARRLCMTPDKLEALEQDAFERFAGATYVRGYIRNLCKELGLDTAAVMEIFARQVPAEVAPQPVRAPVGAVMTSRREKQGGSLFVPFVLVLAMAAGGGYWWFDQQAAGGRQFVQLGNAQDRDDRELLATASSYGAEPDMAQTAEDLEFSALAVPEAQDDTVESSGDAPDIGDGAPETDAELAEASDSSDLEGALAELPPVREAAVAPVVQRSEAPAAVAPVLAAQAQGEAPVAAPSENPVAEPRLVISFQEESWVEVTDATGYKMISKLQPAGSTVQLSGRAPFSVMLGNAAGATVTFDGQTVDSAPIGNRRTRKLSVGG